MALFSRTNFKSFQPQLLRKSNRVHNKGRVVFFPIQPQDLAPEPLTHDPATGWTNRSKRTGLVATKLGMLHDWNEWGTMLPLTALQVDDCFVLQLKTKAREGVDAIQLSARRNKLKNTTKPLMGHFARAGVPPSKTIVEFPITPDAAIPEGTQMFAQHFLPGQFVDVQGITIGKGFQGAMKRWGFAGQPASHGVSLTHRSIGSTGARKDPSKVWKGKKMSGRMGGKQATIRNLQVFEIHPQMNVLLVVGAIPGSQGTQVRIRDATGKKFYEKAPPFPTYFPTPGKPEPPVLKASFPRPARIPKELEGEDEHFKKLMTDSKYRQNWLLQNAPKIRELIERGAQQNGLTPSDLTMRVAAKTLSQLDKPTFELLTGRSRSPPPSPSSPSSPSTTSSSGSSPSPSSSSPSSSSQNKNTNNNTTNNNKNNPKKQK